MSALDPARLASVRDVKGVVRTAVLVGDGDVATTASVLEDALDAMWERLSPEQRAGALAMWRTAVQREYKDRKV